MPLMVKWPGKIKPGQTIDDPAIGIDLLPTFVEAAGGTIKPEEQIDGVSLLPRVQGIGDESLSGRRAVLEVPQAMGRFAVASGNWSLASSPGQSTSCSG